TSYCCCDGPEEGSMVGCNNPSCVYQWFHLHVDCLGLESEPTSKHWYCPDCRNLPAFQRKTEKANK
uniref:PHD-type domain-containing protein n=1 Tax=Amphimedon queenslandica TaxID=400682 RepID=A0A1X7VIP4_AMPQE